MEIIDRLTVGWRAYALIALVALLAVLPGFASIPVTDRDEARFAQATRQMLETGDFVRINVQDEPRNKKPIGIHWMQAAAVALTEPITGNLNTIWAYRIPSLLGVIIAALAAFWGGIPLVGRRAAFVGACLLGATMLLSTEGIIAKTDAMLCGLTTLALAALARLRERMGSGRREALIFWIAIGIAVLVKGPVAPMVVALTLAALFAWERRARWMAPLLWWPGPILAVLIVAPWLIAIQAATDGAFLREAISGDLFPKLGGGDEGHSGPFGYHLALLLLSFFPATIGLAPGLVLAWHAARAPRSESTHGGVRFLIAWAVPTWLVFEILGTKLPHYVLPAFPALALLAGAGLVAAEARGWRISTAVSLVLFALGAAAMVALNGVGTTFMPGDEEASVRRFFQTIILGGAGALVLLIAMLFIKRAEARAAAAILFMLIAMYSLRERILPEARTVLVSAEADAALERAGLGERALTVIGYRETSMAFLTRTDARLLAEADWRAAAANIAVHSAAAVSCNVAGDFDARLAARGLSFETHGEVRGTNYANGDFTCLNVGEIIAAPP
ncbi:MAG: ArnT family glycosyltransferase [Hyphomonadaceae bacterium]